MAKHSYSEEQKEKALRVITEKGVYEASEETGIPERTLYAWQKAQRRQMEVVKSESTPQTLSFPNDPEFEEALREQAAAADHIIDDVLDELLKDVQVLSKRIRHNFDQAPPVSQIMALTRLLDRVIKLDARKPRLESKRKVHLIRYIYMDGSIHKVPPWYKGDESDADQPGWSPMNWRWRRPPHQEMEEEN